VSKDFPKDYAVRLRWRCARDANHLDHTLLGTPTPSVLAGIVPQSCPVCSGLVYIEAPPPSVVVMDEGFRPKSFLQRIFKKPQEPDNAP
jgi:hypothetical protein